jgi:hypothetical protein
MMTSPKTGVDVLRESCACAAGSSLSSRDLGIGVLTADWRRGC